MLISLILIIVLLDGAAETIFVSHGAIGISAGPYGAQKPLEQGNYSLRRPPKLIIPQIFIEQRRATVYSFMCKQICISNKANMTRA